MIYIIMLYMLCGGGVALGICDAYRDQEGAQLVLSKLIIATFLAAVLYVGADI